MPESYLALVDADRIQDYVFATQELKLIRGASTLQDWLNRERIPQAASCGRVITKAGGSVLAVFDTRPAAEAFCASAERLYLKHTAVATASTAVVALDDSDFKARFEALRTLLDRRKFARSNLAPAVASPFSVVCGACGLYPAAASDGEKLQCAACLLRARKSDRGAHLPNGLDPPPDFEFIAARSFPQNYLAYLHIDLDRLGSFVAERATSLEHLQTISQTIDSAVVDSIKSACESLLIEEQPQPDGAPPKRTALYEFPLIGGDDTLLIVPAHRCFEILRLFEEGYVSKAAGLGEYPTFSVGLVIAHHHFPISEFVNLGKALVKNAKRIKPAATSAQGPHSIDFRIVQTALPSQAKSDEEVRASLRPYNLSHFLTLASATRDVAAAVPSSKLNALYSMVQRGQEAASLYYADLLARAKPEHKQALQRSVGPALWTGATRKTTAGDIAELMRFVP